MHQYASRFFAPLAKVTAAGAGLGAERAARGLGVHRWGQAPPRARPVHYEK